MNHRGTGLHPHKTNAHGRTQAGSRSYDAISVNQARCRTNEPGQHVHAKGAVWHGVDGQATNAWGSERMAPSLGNKRRTCDQWSSLKGSPRANLRAGTALRMPSASSYTRTHTGSLVLPLTASSHLALKSCRSKRSSKHGNTGKDC